MLVLKVKREPMFVEIYQGFGNDCCGRVGCGCWSSCEFEEVYKGSFFLVGCALWRGVGH